MKILLLSPELFLADGGIARIMRLYLKALCEICGAHGQVAVLNDEPGRDTRLRAYSNEKLHHIAGCRRSKLGFIRHVLTLGRSSFLPATPCKAAARWWALVSWS